ncbi:MAG: hypothetical protein DMF52_00935 [Acidobacteria bacterium]|nr:MAG: hypothetical protein DMF52_00935 [Acidobacteriota bacterium]
MPSTDFLSELEELKNERLRALTTDGAAALGSGGAGGGEAGGQVRLLQIALANEISVSELAAAWMPSTPEVDIKIALARQAGEQRGDQETVRIYRDFIQPDEMAHQRLGAALLREHATTAELREKARQAVLKTMEIAAAQRATAAARIGTACFPGC